MKKNNYVDDNFDVSLCIKASSIGARDFQNLIVLIEIASFISVVNLCVEQDSTCVRNMDASYKNFLKEKYEWAGDIGFNKLVDLMLSSLVRPQSASDELDLSVKHHVRVRDFYQEIRSVRDQSSLEMNQGKRGSLRSGANLYDLNDWLGRCYGNRLVSVRSIGESDHINIVFNIGSLAVMLGFQYRPPPQDCVVYIENVIRHWLRQKPLINKGDDVGVPVLPLSFERTMSCYDRLDAIRDISGWVLKLGRG